MTVAGPGNWNEVLLDCPHSTCSELLVNTNTTDFLSYLKLSFNPYLDKELNRRRYVWFYTSDHVEVAKIIISELEGYQIQINNGPCGSNITRFTSKHSFGHGDSKERVITVRANEKGVHFTFPDNGTWGSCSDWPVTRIAFDKLWRCDAKYSIISDNPVSDMCGIELNKVTNCESTSYCTESGFCNKEPSCFTKEMESNPLCDSCNLKDVLSCNDTLGCIPPSLICNGFPDCQNGTDEVDCSEQVLCTEGEMLSDGTCDKTKIPSGAMKMTEKISILSINLFLALFIKL